ncbi:baseplate J/gp47 family protein [Arsenophonus sp. PmNCSU2021_1]|uniref:baseplate J/gp47 family protein n=1 Tax=Arsenophonus sp. PmNCSU2021_1 TaxID=3118989 RepID=UPI002FF2E24D
MLNLDTLALSAKVTDDGISAPDYQTLLMRLTDFFHEIYGQDAYLTPDSKDGQMIAIYALAIHDANNALIATYNSFSPNTSKGAALSNNVAINGIFRHASGYSNVDVVLTGQVGTVIKNGRVRDKNGNIWRLPETVTLDTHGEATVTAVCLVTGSVTALAGEITEIATPTRGWQTVNNPKPATQGRPIETDNQLRERQRKSVSLPSRTVLEGIQGAISLISGVTRQRGFENDTSKTDKNGISPHSIAMIVDGGDVNTIANAIAQKKTPGAGTFGDTAVTVKDRYDMPITIRFSRPKTVDVHVEIDLTAFLGFTTLTGDKIRRKVADYINQQLIGDNLYLTRLYSPANLPADEEGKTFDITAIKIGRTEETVKEANLLVAFNEAVSCRENNVKLVVTS